MCFKEKEEQIINKFDWHKWNVPIIQSPDIAKKYINDLELIGKKIKNIKAIGLCYNLTEDSIVNFAYSSTQNNQISNYENIPVNIEFYRFVEVDEPIVIQFDDGDTFEIDFSEASSIKMSKNGLPYDISWGTNQDNADLNVIFSNCIGAKIQDILVITTTENILNNFTGSHEIEKPNLNKYIKEIIIVLDNKQTLNFTAFYDYGHLCSKEFNSEKNDLKDSMIKFIDLKKSLHNT